MSKDFTVDELYDLIRMSSTDPNCSTDELLMLLAECIGDNRIIDEVSKYVDMYYKDIERISGVKISDEI